MAEFFEEFDGLAPGQRFLVLEEVFHPEDQLARLDLTDDVPDDAADEK